MFVSVLSVSGRKPASAAVSRTRNEKWLLPRAASKTTPRACASTIAGSSRSPVEDAVLAAGQRVGHHVARAERRDDPGQGLVGVADVDHDRQAGRLGGVQEPVEDRVERRRRPRSSTDVP